eukprot:gene9056-18759_t
MRASSLIICGPRKPRPGEIDGVHYHFVTEQTIKQAISQNLFLEHAQVHGNIYGTSKGAVETILNSNRICLLDVDVLGVKKMRKLDFSAKYVFIAPPSVEDLEARLRGRATESEEQMLVRLANAKEEIEYGYNHGNFDCIIVNKEVDQSVSQLSSYLEKWFPGILLLNK